MPITGHSISLALTDKDVPEVAPFTAPGDDIAGLPYYIGSGFVATPSSCEVACIVAVNFAA